MSTDSKAQAPAPQPPTMPAGATDVTDFIQSLDGGQFERQLAVVASRVAAASVDHNSTGEMTIKFKMVPIEGTAQVRIEHILTYKRPTETGEATERSSRKTTMHVGKGGRLTLAPENQLDMFKRD